MNTWFARGAVLAACVALVAIRAPHGQRSMRVPVVESHKGPLEKALLTVAWASFFLPLLWVFTPLFRFADYPLRAAPWGLGVACYAAGLWAFHRSHADLGTA